MEGETEIEMAAKVEVTRGERLTDSCTIDDRRLAKVEVTRREHLTGG